MTDNPIQIHETKQLPREEWGAILSTLSKENRGHPIGAEVIGEDIGDQMLFSGPLMAIDYDPVGKGDDIVITAGEVAFGHVIRSPSEIWIARDVNGRIVSLEIASLDGLRTIVSL
jgi:hypothetical protein